MGQAAPCAGCATLRVSRGSRSVGDPQCWGAEGPGDARRVSVGTDRGRAGPEVLGSLPRPASR